MAFFKEFKEFALKGNVMDMAVGVIIGGAFGKIVSSLVNDILMPPIGALIGNTDFSQLRLDISKVRDVASNAVHSVGDAVTGGGDKVVQAAAEPVYWNYGAFIQQCIDFTILAFCVFMMVKLMNRLLKKKEEAPAPAAEPVLERGGAAHGDSRPAERTEEISVRTSGGADLEKSPPRFRFRKSGLLVGLFFVGILL